MISAGQQNQGMPGMPQQPSGGGTETGLTPNIAGLLCYICTPITGIIFMLIEKSNKDVRFHAWQSMIFGVAYIVAMIALQIVAAILGMIASVLGIIVGFFVPILMLAAFILWIVCMVKAYQGERWRIPFIGDIAAKKAGLL